MSRGKQKPDELCKLSWLNIRLTAQERAELDAIARAEGITTTDLARRGLAVIREQQANRTPATPAQA